MTRSVEVCPECDTAKIYRRKPSLFDSGRTSSKAFVCEVCGHNFEEPRTRPTRGTGNEQRGAARKLLEANPEDYPQ